MTFACRARRRRRGRRIARRESAARAQRARGATSTCPIPTFRATQRTRRARSPATRRERRPVRAGIREAQVDRPTLEPQRSHARSAAPRQAQAGRRASTAELGRACVPGGRSRAPPSPPRDSGRAPASRRAAARAVAPVHARPRPPLRAPATPRRARRHRARASARASSRARRTAPSGAPTTRRRAAGRGRAAARRRRTRGRPRRNAARTAPASHSSSRVTVSSPSTGTIGPVPERMRARVLQPRRQDERPSLRRSRRRPGTDAGAPAARAGTARATRA